MRNPFCLPERTISQPGPLNPCKYAAHHQYYVNVDHTEESFNAFSEQMRLWNIIDNGSSVLIHGEDGCGKTSLAFRCAMAATEYLNPVKVRVIDRSSDRLDGQSALSKCQDIVNAILRELRNSTDFITSQKIEELPKTSEIASDMQGIKTNIDDIVYLLEGSQCSLVVITPKLELDSEFKSYMNVFGRGSIVLIMETSQKGVSQSVSSWNEKPGKSKVLMLEVGELEIDQGWEFVQARLAHLELSQNSPAPRFDEEAVVKYMKTRTLNSKVSIRELELVCINLYDMAIKQRKDLIEYDDFSEFWVRIGNISQRANAYR